MKRRGFLGALLGGIVAPFIAPLAVATPVAPAVTTRLASLAGDFDGEVLSVQTPKLGRGFTRCFTHIDEYAWISEPGIKEASHSSFRCGDQTISRTGIVSPKEREAIFARLINSQANGG